MVELMEYPKWRNGTGPLKTLDQKAAIYNLWCSGVMQAKLAKDNGVSVRTISNYIKEIKLIKESQIATLAL